mmetsp:Transcript_4082/g.9602  ORF Transcript_4082/g.9602 Transcript_4082/m.9602 type:complete len:222 (-) Transcript_4082:66-731(-)
MVATCLKTHRANFECANRMYIAALNTSSAVVDKGIAMHEASLRTCRIWVRNLPSGKACSNRRNSCWSTSCFSSPLCAESDDDEEFETELPWGPSVLEYLFVEAGLFMDSAEEEEKQEARSEERNLGAIDERNSVGEQDVLIGKRGPDDDDNEDDCSSGRLGEGEDEEEEEDSAATDGTAEDCPLLRRKSSPWRRDNRIGIVPVTIALCCPRARAPRLAFGG